MVRILSKLPTSSPLSWYRKEDVVLFVCEELEVVVNSNNRSTLTPT